MTIDPDGKIYGISTSSYNDQYAVFGTATESGDLSFAAGYTSDGSTFNGTVDSSGKIQGTWHDPGDGETGTFNGNGQIGAPIPSGIDAFVGKYSGTYTGDDYGTFNMYVDAYGNVVVVIVSGDAAIGTINSNGSFTVKDSYGNISASGTISSSGNATGTWKDSYYYANGTFTCSKQ